MDGNYSRCLPQRLARATGFILLDTSTATSLLPTSADRPVHHVGILILMHVDVWQHEPPRFDRVLNDGERPSGFRPGELEHHAHASKADRTALTWLHDDRLQIIFRSLSSSLSFRAAKTLSAPLCGECPETGRT